MGELESLIFQQRRSEAAYEQRRREQLQAPYSSNPTPTPTPNPNPNPTLQAQRRLDDVSALERDIARAGAYQGQAAAQRSSV